MYHLQHGKVEPKSAPHDDDTPYSRLLQQQQMYLQLQIMNKQFSNHRYLSSLIYLFFYT